MEIARFALVSRIGARRRQEWDEVYVVQQLRADGEWLCYTLSDDGNSFGWICLRVTDGDTRMIEGTGADRAARGVRAPAINWMCIPPACTDMWVPFAGHRFAACSR